MFSISLPWELIHPSGFPCQQRADFIVDVRKEKPVGHPEGQPAGIITMKEIPFHGSSYNRIVI